MNGKISATGIFAAGVLAGIECSIDERFEFVASYVKSGAEVEFPEFGLEKSGWAFPNCQLS